MNVIETFRNRSEQVTSIVAEVNGDPYLLYPSEQNPNMIHIWPYVCAFDGLPGVNPAWGKLEKLIKAGLIEDTFEEGDYDRYIWRGESIPELDKTGANQ